MSTEDTQTAMANARFVEQIHGDEHHEVVGAWALRPVGGRPSLNDYVRELHRRRHFVWADARARAFSGESGTLLGNAWLVVKPLLDGLTYYLIFGLLLQVSRGIDNYVGYLLVGVFLFSYTSRSLTGGASALVNGRNMIRGFSFPRAALPISVVIREAVGMVPVVTTMVALILLIPPHAEVTWRWALFPALFALQTVFNTGLALIAARLTVHVPDLRNVLSFVTRLWLYGSAVMFSFDRFVTDERLLTALELNPAFLVLDISRDLLLYGADPIARSWVTLGAWALVTFVVGLVFFWRAEDRYGHD